MIRRYLAAQPSFPSVTLEHKAGLLQEIEQFGAREQ